MESYSYGVKRDQPSEGKISRREKNPSGPDEP